MCARPFRPNRPKPGFGTMPTVTELAEKHLPRAPKGSKSNAKAQRRASGIGRTSTLITGPSGVLEQANIGQATLLGG